MCQRGQRSGLLPGVGKGPCLTHTLAMMLPPSETLTPL